MEGTLNVEKGLVAIGGSTPDSTIVFTSIHDDFYGGDSNSNGSETTPTVGNWSSIFYKPTSLAPLSELKHVIIKNSSFGLRVTSASPTVTYSSIRDNSYAAFISGSSQPIFNYCDIRDNQTNGILNTDGTFTTDATNNWWGDPSGPTHSGNPTGIGQNVSDFVDYAPFLSGPTKPLMGDVSLNEEIQAFDASLILQFAAGLLSLDATQQSVSDVSALSGISAFDAAMILQYVVGILDAFPAESILRTEVPEVSDVVMTLGNQEVTTGETFTVPIHLNDVENLLSMEIHLDYDPNVLTLEGIEYLDYIDNMQSITNDTEVGKIKMILAGLEYMNGDGTMANLTFRVNDNVSTQSQTMLNVQHFLANETLLTDLVQGGLVNITSTITRINELNQMLQDLSIYPNPSKDHVIISYDQSIHQAVQVHIYNSLGKQIIYKELANNNQVFDLVKYPAGIYWIKVKIGTQFRTEKIMITH